MQDFSGTLRGGELVGPCDSFAGRVDLQSLIAKDLSRTGVFLTQQTKENVRGADVPAAKAFTFLSCIHESTLDLGA
jgi:hypothetical protein